MPDPIRVRVVAGRTQMAGLTDPTKIMSTGGALLLDMLPPADARLGDPLFAAQSAARLVARAARTPMWTVGMEWADEAGADDPTFHLRRLTQLLVSREPAAPIRGAKRLGRYLEALRTGMELSRIELGRRAGIDPVAIALAEQGALSPVEAGAVFLSRMALGLAVGADHLEDVASLGAPVDPKPAGNTLIERVWVVVAGFLAPVPSFLASSSLLGAEPALNDATEGWSAGLRDNRVSEPFGLEPFEITGADGQLLTVLGTIGPNGSSDGGGAALDLHDRGRDAKPATGISLRLTVLEIPGMEDAEPTATTDDQGHATFTDVPLGQILKRIEREGAWPISVAA